jgi:hypothetical protein
VGKYFAAGQAIDDGTAHAHCMLDTKDSRHTLRTCNTYCFFNSNGGCTNAPQCYVIRTLPVLLPKVNLRMSFRYQLLAISCLMYVTEYFCLLGCDAVWLYTGKPASFENDLLPLS